MSIDPFELYRQATTDIAVFDCSSFGKLALRGKDAASFLQNFTTNDVVKPGPGSVCEAFVLTAQAKIVAWVRVAIGKDGLYLHTDPGLVPRLREHLERHQIGEEVEFEDRTEADGLWHFCGPRLIERFGTLDSDRVVFLGLPGSFITVPRSESEDVRRSLENHKTGRIPLGDLNHPAWTMLRVEAGTPQCGVDFDETNLPQEVNRTEQAISFTKGCYLGQETVARIRAFGHVNKQLMPIKFPNQTEANWAELTSWCGAALTVNGKEVGRVKTVAYSPKLGCWLAFAMLRREQLAVGTRLDAVHTSGETATVEVTLWPSAASIPGT